MLSSPLARPLVRLDRALGHKSKMRTSTSAQKLLPMLIPVSEAASSVSENEAGNASGVAVLVVVAAGDTLGDSLVEKD